MQIYQAVHVNVIDKFNLTYGQKVTEINCYNLELGILENENNQRGKP